jgi:hypothetical protein
MLWEEEDLFYVVRKEKIEVVPCIFQCCNQHKLTILKICRSSQICGDRKLNFIGVIFDRRDSSLTKRMWDDDNDDEDDDSDDSLNEVLCL